MSALKFAHKLGFFLCKITDTFQQLAQETTLEEIF